MSEWQPIETAPRDGTMLVLWLPHEGGIGWGSSGTPDDPWWGAPFGCYDEYMNPSHWMPLPDPPGHNI
ncbi:MAG: DUF551 domain-containing protein [Phycisphaerales bacterium]|nr:DUF551 domain-containing protein [Phycisphaerales bacterium]